MTKRQKQTQLASFYDRWSRMEDARREASDDFKELFAEGKGNGFNPKAMRRAFAEHYRLTHENAGDKSKRETFEGDVALYLDELVEKPDETETGTPVATHAGLRDEPRIDVVSVWPLPPRDEAGVITETTEPATRAPDPGVAAAEAGEGPHFSPADIQPETAEQTGTASPPDGSSPAESEAVAISAPIPTEAERIAAKFVTPIQKRMEAVQAEMEAAKVAPKNPYRPHCLRPEMCASSEARKHCFTCAKDLADAEGFTA